jgi:hypothetical protein
LTLLTQSKPRPLALGKKRATLIRREQGERRWGIGHRRRGTRFRCRLREKRRQLLCNKNSREYQSQEYREGLHRLNLLSYRRGGCKSVLENYHPHMFRLALLFLLPVLAVEASERKPPTISIRLHAEGNPREGETFVVPVTLLNPPKQTVIRKVPIVTERDIVSFYPFAAADGTIGCYFKLDADGTNKLMQHTIEYRDTLVVAMVNGRVACTMMVGQKITDGIMTFPSGFLAKEIVELQARYPIVGKEKQFPEQKKKALAALKEARKKESKEAKGKPASQSTPQ